MCDFKVGDTVRIRSDLDVSESYKRHFVTLKMLEFAGCSANIMKDITEDGHSYTLDIDEGFYGWDRQMFEPPEIRETDTSLIIKLYAN